MTTRLSIFCDKLLEAGWLAALVVAPLFFDVYSSRVFEPDKISLVRSLALLMIAAWLVRRIENGMPRAPIAETLRTSARENPLVLPTLAIVVVYIIATIFSVAPAISFWGSYQRLQGTYTTLSYIAISLIAASSLRTRAQFDRAINTALVTSFPIALYGLLQHFQLDPLPWVGDVTFRVAANMGNSIFVAAYLILVVPLALARWMETLARATKGAPSRVAFIGVVAFALLALSAVWVFDFALGVAGAFVLLLFALAFAWLAKVNMHDVLLTAAYTIILAALFVAIFFTQSRGPWLGLGGGLFAFVVLYALARGARRVMLGVIGLGAAAALFLVIFNLPIAALDPLKQVPYVGRLGEIFESRAGTTGRVRELIWQGALQLVTPHAPLWSPTTGDDALNVIRPLVGYGPEAMYVAFNPFYPPELGHTEARNASPDRSHNETFDALVTTGLLGFGAYILLFISVFYSGLKWLGMISTSAERNAFVALWLAGGLISALIFGLWRGWDFVGVALPAGMILGFFVFLVTDALRRYRAGKESIDPHRALWLSALIAALIGHFVEIHFGIAIVSTRLYFWFYVALLVVIGMNRLVEPATASAVPAPRAETANEAPRAPTRRRRRRRASESAHTPMRTSDLEMSPAPIFAWTAAATLILVTLAFEFVNNQAGTPSTLEALLRALFFKGQEPSFGVFILLAATWIIAGIIGLGTEMPRTHMDRNTLLLAVALYAVLSFTAWLWYTLFQLRSLTQPGDLTDAFVNILGLYCVALFLLVVALATSLMFDAPTRGAALWHSPVNLVVTPLLVIVLIGLVYWTNLAGVSGDIMYKSGNNYDNMGAWDRSISAYQRALALQSDQDFYALFLGRAYLEAARSVSDPTRRATLIGVSEKMLLSAQQLNPLNTDHTANLARLHRIVAGMIDNPTEKSAHLQKSSDYYRAAVRLSPNTAHLRNEWSQTYFLSGDLEQGRAQLEQSLKLDTQYAQTYLYWGEYYRAKHDDAKAVENYLQALALDLTALSDVDGTLLSGPLNLLAKPEVAPRIIEAYRDAAQKNPTSLQVRYALAELYKQSGQLERARQELEQATKIAPNDYAVHLALVNFFSETGQIDAAVNAMRRVMELVSPTQTADYSRFQDFYAQLQRMQGAIQATQKSPNDVTAHRTLAVMWRARGQPQFALPEYQAIARLAPNDYDAQKNAALLSLQLNQTDDAQRALVAAAALAPENEKAMWQNVQVALNAQKTGQLDQASKAAQAALALASAADKPALQAYVTFLQEQVAIPR